MDRPFPPTKRRIERALAEGNVPVSRFSLRAAAFGAALLLMPRVATELASRFRELLEAALRGPAPGSPALLAPSLEPVLLPILAGVAATAIVTGLAQTGGRFRLGRPKGTAASRRGAGLAGLAALRGVACAAALAIALSVVLGSSGRELRDALVPATSLAASLELLRRTSLGLGVALCALALADVVLTRALWLSSLRMSRRELIEERRMSEAPARIRQARRRAFEALVRSR